ncbi:unnamed protein product, partial [Owenia fusiformis]
MTYLGTAGNTATEMKDVLKYPACVHPLFKALLTALNVPNNDYTLNAANNLFPDDGFMIEQEYRNNVIQFYFATLKELDFENNSTVAREYINEWVSNHTEEKIPELLQEGDVTALTVLFLVNAIYFKGDWLNKFNPDLTEPATFHVSPSNQIQVEMMYNQSTYRYYEDNTLNAQLLELPYAGEDISMIVILPNDLDGLSSLEATLNPINLKAALNELLYPRSSTHTSVQVWLPKFEMKLRYKLKEYLQALGMVDAFNFGADFSPLCGSCGVFISAVIHEAFVKVNEEGIEATAATAATIFWSLPKRFRADHPFLFVIRHKQSGTILFMGRVALPQTQDDSGTSNQSCLTKIPCPKKRKGKLSRCCGCKYMFADPKTKRIMTPKAMMRKYKGRKCLE